MLRRQSSALHAARVAVPNVLLGCLPLACPSCTGVSPGVEERHLSFPGCRRRISRERVTGAEAL